MSALFGLHCAVTWALAGLIWTIQLVHYPLFDRVDRACFAEFQREHSRRISWLAGPLMLLEVVSGMGLIWAPPASVAAQRSTFVVSLGLIGVIWIATFALQVPHHRTLSRGFDAGAHRALVQSNWIRAAAWTGRALLLASIAVH